MTRRGKINPGGQLDVVPHPSDIIRFMQKIRVINGCWQWIGRKDENGYGQFYLHPSRGGVPYIRKKGYRSGRTEGSMIGAHRYAVALFKGRIEAGMDVDHCATEECIGHACVHPFKHLMKKTRAQNSSEGARRRIEKNCARKGILGYTKPHDDIPF